jgi:hypothetical protein
MSEREMSEAERKALSKINKFLNQHLQGLLGWEHEHGETTGRGRSDYIYWEAPDQRMFCYTPWKDANGDYWTWVMKPFGRGARSGNARKWKRVGKRVRARTRKTARKRAQTRYRNWLKYLAQEWRNE